MMELEEHPFIQSVPENDFHVSEIVATYIYNMTNNISFEWNNVYFA